MSLTALILLRTLAAVGFALGCLAVAMLVLLIVSHFRRVP